MQVNRENSPRIGANLQSGPLSSANSTYHYVQDHDETIVTARTERALSYVRDNPESSLSAIVYGYIEEDNGDKTKNVAGALAAKFGDRKPDEWKQWLGVAESLIESLQSEGAASG